MNWGWPAIIFVSLLILFLSTISGKWLAEQDREFRYYKRERDKREEELKKWQ